MNKIFLSTQDKRKYDISIYYENNKWLIIIGNVEYFQEKDCIFVNSDNRSTQEIKISFDSCIWKLIIDGEVLVEINSN